MSIYSMKNKETNIRNPIHWNDNHYISDTNV